MYIYMREHAGKGIKTTNKVALGKQSKKFTKFLRKTQNGA